MSKVVIVTGASRGIGAAVAKRLLSHDGVSVVLTARSRDALEAVKTSHPGRVEYVVGDVTEAGVRFSPSPRQGPETRTY